jgi:predicted TIM-barrel fold metal-dependent hydrolase
MNNNHPLNRRSWLAGLAGASAVSALQAGCGARRDAERPPSERPLAVTEYKPRAALHIPVTRVPRSRFPVIDAHVHLSSVASRPMPSSDVPRNEGGEGPRPSMSTDPKDVLALMDRKNIRMMVNATGGYGPALDEVIRYWHKPHPDRFLVCTEPWWTRTNQPDYAKFQGLEIERAAKAGARGLKILKTLGLYLRENLNSGPLVKVDDRRFDPMWEAAGANNLPVLIHTSDPESFFDPVDQSNEYYALLLEHPDWSFHGRDFPSNRELHEARDRVVARHPRTQFLLLHMGNSQNLGYMAEILDRYPNTTVEFGQRIGDLGRQPRVSMKFFDRYQDRILFGSDVLLDTPERLKGKDETYEIYFRFLETDDDYFESDNSPWRIYGIKLPERTLRKVYYENAERLFRIRS